MPPRRPKGAGGRADRALAGPEYFFIGQRSGHGREPHIDYACEGVWSAQIRGRKRWRLQPPDAGVMGFELRCDEAQPSCSSAAPAVGLVVGAAAPPCAACAAVLTVSTAGRARTGGRTGVASRLDARHGGHRRAQPGAEQAVCGAGP